MSDKLYLRAGELAEQGKLEQAWKIISRMLIENPKDPRALLTGSFIMRRLGHLPQAYHFAKSAAEIWPHDPSIWLNWGHACRDMWLTDEAERHYRRMIRLAKNIKDQRDGWLSLSALYLDDGRFADAEILCRKLLEVDPEDRSAFGNLGFCLLAKRDWSGWKGYHNTIGTDWRPMVRYRDEPEWDGSLGKIVALYEDQGLGDAISFASMLSDAQNICKKLIVECDARLQSLFTRSFPGVKFYGTRGMHDAKWDREDWAMDASLPLGQIGEFFRLKDEDFPGTPYLRPCPDRVKQWRALFESKGKPCIGIAWTGGIPKTNARNRKIALTDLLPVFTEVDAHYVSLQYKDASEDITAFKAEHPEVDIVQYKWATLTQDYDDTAALIASLDYVLCIQTAVAHTAGALGTPATVLVPTATQWRYGNSTETVPWYNCLRVIRQRKSGSWSSEIERASRELGAYLARVPRRAAKAA